MLGGLGSLKHVPFDANYLYQFITPHSTLNATQLTKAPTKHFKIPLSLPIYSTLKFTYVTEYDRRPHSNTQSERNEQTTTNCSETFNELQRNLRISFVQL